MVERSGNPDKHKIVVVFQIGSLSLLICINKMAAVQNGFCHISTIVHTPHAPLHPRNVLDIFYFVPGTYLNMKSGYHHH